LGTLLSDRQTNFAASLETNYLHIKNYFLTYFVKFGYLKILFCFSAPHLVTALFHLDCSATTLVLIFKKIVKRKIFKNWLRADERDFFGYWMLDFGYCMLDCCFVQQHFCRCQTCVQFGFF